MKVSRILFFFILFCSFSCFATVKEPVAVNGLMDLRETAGNAFIVKLQGQWEFYWRKMLLPQDFKGSTRIKPDFYGQIILSIQ
jgi:hypothetical protein